MPETPCFTRWLSALCLAAFPLLVAGDARAADPSRGQMLWNRPGSSGINMCSDCHGTTPAGNVSRIWNASGTAADQGLPSVIRQAIGSQREMAEFSTLSSTDLDDLASYINAVRYNKAIEAPALSREDCLFAWAESILPAVFRAPAVQQGRVSTISYRLYNADSGTTGVGLDGANGQVWVLAQVLGFADAAPLDAVTSASLLSQARGAGCR